eukprot:gb/GECH01001008.1/.p1 GENE.gb/GECH01001008.1/~~gb/GECH01001008.1/.p1  ORF type:complete len:460 (+),score=127.83 gb/GECH01001008.1/:1-1380(+)
MDDVISAAKTGSSSDPIAALSSSLHNLVLLAVIGGIGGVVMVMGETLKSLILRYIGVVLTLSDSNDEFFWFMSWLSTHPYTQQSSQVTVVKKQSHSHFNWANFSSDMFEKKEVDLVPAPGNHVFWHNKRLIWITFQQEKQKSPGFRNVPDKQYLTIRVFPSDRRFLETLLDEAQTEYQRRQTQETSIFIPQYSDEWRRSVSRPKRSRHTLLLPNEMVSSLVDDAQEFLVSESWYRSRGIPWRRGYLLYGPPGTGKTSLVSVLAGELEMNICQLSLSNKDMNDEALNTLLDESPPRSIILIEDIDVAFNENAGSKNLTYSGILNALDGVAAQEGRITIMTTNHIEELKPALIRPGRVDRRILIDYAQEYQVKGMFMNFFPEEEFSRAEELSMEFYDHLRPMLGRITTAALQGHLMRFKRDPNKAVSYIDDLKEEVREEEERLKKIEEENKKKQNKENKNQ